METKDNGEEEREKVGVWEDKGVETKNNRKGSSSGGNKKKPLVRSTKKWHLLRAAQTPPLGRRIKPVCFPLCQSFGAV